MPDMFNVQMNAAEAPTAQPRTAQSSSAPSSEPKENSFQAVLAKEQQATDSSGKKATQESPSKPDNNRDNTTATTQTDSLVSDTTQEAPAVEIVETDVTVADFAAELMATEEAIAPLIVNLTTGDSHKKDNIFKQFTNDSTTDSDKASIMKAGADVVVDDLETSSLQDFSAKAATTQQPGADNLTVNSDSRKTLTPQQETLLLKIQNLIEKGDAGTVTIQKSALPNEPASLRQQLGLLSAVQVQEVEQSQTQQARIVTSATGFTELEDGVFGQTLRSRQQQLAGLRQDATHQFYDAKTQPQSSGNDANNLTGNQQGGEMAQHGSGFNQSSTVGSQADTTSTFSLSGTSTADAAAAQSADTTKTTILPSGTLVHDHEVIQQMVERFQINKRAVDSKIQMKLHPVELGEMEIDLTVKEGSIRANVVAQSQHVQEILERNLNKLKTVLEQQGFSIEEITVTTESDMVGEFDLFDQQLPGKKQPGFAGTSQQMESLTPFVIEEIEGDYLGSPTGVNVKV